MAIVSAVLGIIIFIIILILKYSLDTSYYENAEYFILKLRKKEYKVYYEDIVDWKSAFNEIALLNKSRSDKEYVKININFFKPELLLRKIADRTFDGAFCKEDNKNSKDPCREKEIVRYLFNNNYGYLIEDYVEGSHE